MKTTLQQLVEESGFTQKEFAKRVGVEVEALRYQLKRKNTLDWSFTYAKKLNVKSIKGFESGCYVELVIS